MESNIKNGRVTFAAKNGAIPLNIDAPSGVPFSVNRQVYVENGRLSAAFDVEHPKIRLDGDIVNILHMNAREDICVNLMKKDARLLAYEILKATE